MALPSLLVNRNCRFRNESSGSTTRFFVRIMSMASDKTSGTTIATWSGSL